MKFHFSTVHFIEVRGLATSSYRLYDYTTNEHKGTVVYTCNVYGYRQCKYISVQNIYLFFYGALKMLKTHITYFFKVHSDRTVVVLLLKHLVFRMSPFFYSSSIITNCEYATMSLSNITVYVTLH
jgi:hypothetical protein